jgi:hypothetical protein
MPGLSSHTDSKETAEKLDESVAKLWSAAACCRFPPSQLAGWEPRPGKQRVNCWELWQVRLPRASSQGRKRQRAAAVQSACGAIPLLSRRPSEPVLNLPKRRLVL